MQGMLAVWTLEDSSIRSFKNHLQAVGRGNSTIDAYGRDCGLFLDFLREAGVATGDINPKTLDEFQDFLRAKGAKDNSVRRSVIGVRQFFRFLQDHFRWDQSPFDESILPEREDSFTHCLTSDDLAHLITVARRESSPTKSARDIAMLSVLGIEGIKAGELIALQWRDLFISDMGGRLTIRGERTRSISIEPATLEALKSYEQALATLGKPELTAPNANMFVAFRGQDARALLPEITRHGIKFSLYELGQAAGLQHLNTETLRHHAMAHKIALGFAPDALMQHLGLRTLGKISRHYGAALAAKESAMHAPITRSF